MVAGVINGELIAPMAYEETMTSAFFEAWFQKFLLPTVNKPSVIIMDNARFHRMGKLYLLCEEFGHKLLPLLPYTSETHFKKSKRCCQVAILFSKLFCLVLISIDYRTKSHL